MDSITIILPSPTAPEVRELLQSSPGITFTEKRGFFEHTFRISGEEQALALLRPKLTEVSGDWVSQDAW